jgi:hypothetical protein
MSFQMQSGHKGNTFKVEDTSEGIKKPHLSSIPFSGGSTRSPLSSKSSLPQAPIDITPVTVNGKVLSSNHRPFTPAGNIVSCTPEPIGSPKVPNCSPNQTISGLPKASSSHVSSRVPNFKSKRSPSSLTQGALSSKSPLSGGLTFVNTSSKLPMSSFKSLKISSPAGVSPSEIISSQVILEPEKSSYGLPSATTVTKVSEIIEVTNNSRSLARETASARAPLVKVHPSPNIKPTSPILQNHLSPSPNIKLTSPILQNQNQYIEVGEKKPIQCPPIKVSSPVYQKTQQDTNYPSQLQHSLVKSVLSPKFSLPTPNAKAYNEKSVSMDYVCKSPVRSRAPGIEIVDKVQTLSNFNRGKISETSNGAPLPGRCQTTEFYQLPMAQSPPTGFIMTQPQSVRRGIYKTGTGSIGDPLPITSLENKKGRELPRSPTPTGNKYHISPHHRLRESPPGTPHFAIPPPRAEVPQLNVRPVGIVGTATTQRPPEAAPEATPPPAVTGYNPNVQQAAPTAPRPNYSAMSEDQQADMRNMFRAKFGTLRASFTEWNIQDPSDTMSLDKIHDSYEGYVKQIMVSLNSSQWKVYLVIFFLAIEVFGIKVLGINFKGYTKSQVKLLSRYDRLLVELGEKYYVQGASQWSTETRFIMMAGFNAVIFCVVKYLSKWLGGDAMAETIQGFVDQMMGGGSMFTSSGPQKDENGLTIVPSESVKQQAASQGNDSTGGLASLLGGGDGGGIASMLGSLMGGGGGESASGGGMDMSSMIANVGNMLTKSMAVPGETKASSEAKGKESQNAPTKASSGSKRRVVFGS